MNFLRGLLWFRKMIMPDDFVYNTENIGFTLSEASKYTNDSLFLKRNQAFVIIQKAGSISKVETEKMKAVEILSKGCLDENTGISRYVAKSLQEYARPAFPIKAHENIGKSLKAGSKSIAYLSLLAGYLNLVDYKDNLYAVASNTKIQKRNKWYAHLALARMGEEKSISYCLKIYKEQKTSSEVVEEMIPDLLYTRQREYYDEIIKILYSDKKDCRSANPNNEKSILCGYMVMEQLASYIKDYPLETHASGEIKTDDYDKALDKLRKWFKRNNNYVILDEKF